MKKPSARDQRNIRHACETFKIPLPDNPSAGQWQAAAIRCCLVGQVMQAAGTVEWDRIRREAVLEGADGVFEGLEGYGYEIVTTAEWLRMQALDETLERVRKR